MMGAALSTAPTSAVQQGARTACLKLLRYCHERNWSGYDPYDALNSRLFTSVPLLDSRVPRLAVTQLLKRSPINLRRLLLVPPTQNPKAVALFLSATLKLRQLGEETVEALPERLADRLMELRSTGTRYSCWGYSFPWQTRTDIVPRGTPNLVCTTFAAGALLDLYDATGNRQYLNVAASAASYIVNELYRTRGFVAGFSYPLPSMPPKVHNANFLAAALLTRVAHATGNSALVSPALNAARYSASRQQPDGCWAYGEAPTQQWVDNFHTGYNLCALQDVGRYVGTSEFEPHVERGFTFYRRNFFLEDGTPKYFHDSTYPIDIHCSAQSVITLIAMRDRDPESVDLAERVLQWTIDRMWDDRGFFYYRVLRFGKIRTSYMRWSQAWMLTALATFLADAGTATAQSRRHFPGE